MTTCRNLNTSYLLPRALGLAVLMAMVGCDTDRDTDVPPSRPADPVAANPMGPAAAINGADQSGLEYASAKIGPTTHGNVEGTITFSAGDDGPGMRIGVELEGLEPGLHGFHVHETGDCSADDASSAGGHFDPYGHDHGSPDSAEKHVGDLGNLEADADGRVATNLTVRGLAFSGPASILQKAIVIHRGQDDLASQPAGDAGIRVGCGVIRLDATARAPSAGNSGE